ncbi:plasmid stabilization protein [Methylobacillus methanolivorans]
MASLTIRNLDDALKTKLRLQAAEHGWSMEQEAREILRRAVSEPGTELGFAQKIRQRFAGLEGELEIPARQTVRQIALED